MLTAMQTASDQFYAAAVRIANHPFIEFTGLLNEYIKCCGDALGAGIDYSQCSVHTGTHLPLLPHRIAYLSEKLECIYGTANLEPRGKEEAVHP